MSDRTPSGYTQLLGYIKQRSRSAQYEALHEKLQPLVAEIGWTHNLVILD